MILIEDSRVTFPICWLRDTLPVKYLISARIRSFTSGLSVVLMRREGAICEEDEKMRLLRAAQS